MKVLSKQFIPEFFWLIGSLLLTVLFAFFLFGLSMFKSSIDILIKDTYFVISGWQLHITLFSEITFITFFIRTFKNRYAVKWANWIMVISGGIHIFLLTALIRVLSQVALGGFTIYPPLSGLEEKSIQYTSEPLVTSMTNFLISIQLLVLVLLLSAIYQWGARKVKE